ncbi:ribosomal protein L7/L12 [Bernardetia sp.]|uniref:ribosomal protein L7/L12 n=1 Tax=Bernardetia sp. TaxID=1937974 RepID=UPI0025C5A8D9|nr:ribosomal protein L7/L12 [Bernardetia sp.]
MAFHYFQSYDNYFWQWEENGEVVSIPNGQTIAYRNYLIEVLETLAPQTLPSFGLILLGLIGTNVSFSENDLETIKQNFRSAETYEKEGKHWEQNIDKAFNLLRILKTLPNEYKTGTKRILVLQAIFENTHNSISVKKSKRLIEQLKEKDIDSHKELLSYYPLNSDFKPMGLVADKFPTRESILEKIASIPRIKPQKIEVEDDKKQQPSKTKETDLIEELQKDKDTFVIGSLIPSLFAGLNIPFHNTQPSQQPLGGVSDLTNKGSYDRLLISEYANDDLIFLSRLANNEALFINREVPPHQNDSERIFLIDISLKNWGTPKILTFAVAIAIAEHPKSDFVCHFYLVSEKKYQKIALDTVHNVIQSLLHFGTDLTAKQGIETFFDENIKELDLKNKEVFYLSSTEAIQNTETKTALEEYKKYISYWIHTDLETENYENKGKVTLYKKKQNSKTHIQTLKLDLNRLWANSPTRKNRRKKNKQELQLYSLILKNAGSRKLEVIKKIRDIMEVSLGKAKDVVEYTPQTIKKNLYLKEANRLRDEFEEIGAVVQLIEEEKESKNTVFECPILFPEVSSKIKMYFSDTEFYMITNQKSLMRLTLSKKHQGYYVEKGWERLNQNLKYKGGDVQIGLDEFEERIILMFDASIKEISIQNVGKDFIRKKISFPQWKWSSYSRFVHFKGLFYYIQSPIEYSEIEWDSIGDREIEITTHNESASQNLIDAYNEYSKNISKIPKALDLHSVLKNVKQVYINSENELVISKHKLILNTGKIIKLEVADYRAAKKIMAHAESKNEFVFPDGSSIYCDKDGMFVLKSSDIAIPVIYVPACLDTSLGVGTDEFFAGNTYFLPLETHLKQIETTEFYKKTIQQFINSILESVTD